MYHFFKVNSFSILLFHLNLNRKLKVFSKIADHNKLIRVPKRIKLRHDWLKVLKMRCLILGFLLLLLEVLFNLTPDTANKSLKASKVFPKKGLEVEQCDGSGVLVTALLLSPFEPDRAIEKWSYKSNTIHPGCIWYFKIILRLLTEVVAFHVRLTLISFLGPSLKRAFLRLC